MILYHALTTYHFLNCVVHRLLYHPNEKAILLIDINDLPRSGYPDYQAIIELGFFDSVIRFPSAQFNDTVSPSSLNPFFENLLLPNKIQDFREIYVAGIHSDFAIYLSINQIRFAAFEDGAGLLSRIHEFIFGLSINFPKRRRLLKKYGLDDFSCREIDRIFINENAQLPNFHDPRGKSFDVVSEFTRLRVPQREAILNWFGFPKIDFSQLRSRNVMLLTQSLSSNGFMSFESECRMVKKIVSTYANESELVIKPHPDNLLPLETFFPQAYILPAPFPLELFPIISPRKFSRLIEIDSAGARTIDDFFNKTVVLYWDYLKSYVLEDEYKAALAHFQTVPGLKTVLTIGIDQYHISALMNRIFPELAESDVKRIKFISHDHPSLTAGTTPEQPYAILLDSEKARETEKDQVNRILSDCLARDGSVIALNNLRGDTIQKDFPILETVPKDARLINADAEIGKPKRLILFYNRRNNRTGG